MDFSNLDLGGRIIAEYVWPDGSAIHLRSKARTLDKKIEKVEDLPDWNAGSAPYIAEEPNQEIILKPQAIYRDPFRKGDHILVLCDTWRWEDKTRQKLIPCRANFRHAAKQIFDAVKDEEPWYGFEQEYQLLDAKSNHPYKLLGQTRGDCPRYGGTNYCSVGADVCFGRQICEEHYYACLYAGLALSGVNAEDQPGQWEWQVGPVTGIDLGDQVTIARYILARITEKHGYTVSYEPKLVPDKTGSGGHMNFSTKTMRSGVKGMKYIEDMMVEFGKRHKEHMNVYGVGNEARLNGIHYASTADKFDWGIGDRLTSFRIPTQVVDENGANLVEDRRPAPNIEPYIVSAMIADTGINGADKCMAHDIYAQFQEWNEWCAKYRKF